MDTDFELIDRFVKTKALKYKALEAKNKCIDDKMVYGDLFYGDDLILEITNDYEKKSIDAAEAEYKLYKYIEGLNIYNLNRFISLVKLYNKNKENEMLELSSYLNSKYHNDIKMRAIEKITYYEKFEKISIKNILYIVIRRKADLFGMKSFESMDYARKEVESMFKIEILDPKVKVRK